MKSDDRRNFNPHKAAVAAMWLYGAEYAAQKDGWMYFWDKLAESKKEACRGLVANVLNAPEEGAHEE